MHCPGENATDPIWRVPASSQGISSWTHLTPQHSNPNPNPLANQLWCIDFLTPPIPLIISAFLESLMPLKNWCSIHATWSNSIGFCGIFPSLKHNFMAYRSSKVSDCIFEIHQLWQSGFSRVYLNSCCRYSFEAEIIKISQSSHKMYCNNIVNFQMPVQKKSGNLLKAPRISTFLVGVSEPFNLCNLLYTCTPPENNLSFCSLNIFFRAGHIFISLMFLAAIFAFDELFGYVVKPLIMFCWLKFLINFTCKNSMPDFRLILLFSNLSSILCLGDVSCMTSFNPRRINLSLSFVSSFSNSQHFDVLVGRVFANGPGDRRSIPGRVIPKTFNAIKTYSFVFKLDVSKFNHTLSYVS